MRAVTLIPATGEFAYDDRPRHRHRRDDLARICTPMRRHRLERRARPARGAACPTSRRVSLVVALVRHGSSHRRMRAEAGRRDGDKDHRAVLVGLRASRATRPMWSRSRTGGRPMAARRPTQRHRRHPGPQGRAASASRSIRSSLWTFRRATRCPILIGGPGSRAYPWRGRITCNPAPGQPGTADRTAAARPQIAAFVGTAAPGDFADRGDDSRLFGPGGMVFRRFMLHHAHLAEAAGGVDAFLIGSELRGATTLRSSASIFPSSTALVALAADVQDACSARHEDHLWRRLDRVFRRISRRTASGDVYFHLDPLWASPAIDAVGIDVYWPLSDWRDGAGHLDRSGGPLDLRPRHLERQRPGGEGFDWYYRARRQRARRAPAQHADHRRRLRQALGVPAEGHRSTGGRTSISTGRAASRSDRRPTGCRESKPIWFTEVGCPAVDKGSNQPNVFLDPKARRASLPYFSRGTRTISCSAAICRRSRRFFDPDARRLCRRLEPGLVGLWRADGRCGRSLRLDLGRAALSRLPARADGWSDGGNWELGHWLTGRVGGGASRGGGGRSWKITVSPVTR